MEIICEVFSFTRAFFDCVESNQAITLVLIFVWFEIGWIVWQVIGLVLVLRH